MALVVYSDNFQIMVNLITLLTSATAFILEHRNTLVPLRLKIYLYTCRYEYNCSQTEKLNIKIYTSTC